MAKTTNDRIAAIELEIEQLGNQRKELLQKQKEADRTARTSRLCKRGGLLESMLPDTITLTDERFKTLLEMTIASNDGKELLAELKAEQEKQTADNDAVTAAQDEDKLTVMSDNPTPPNNPAPTAKTVNSANNANNNAPNRVANQPQNVSGASAANGANKPTQAG
jgi:hypothetical protein